MGQATAIEWADSSLNLMMGCDGCELWNPDAGNRHCYAGTLTERYKGKSGWPLAFDKPALFLDRLDDAIRWPDMTGTARPGKPWLDGRPRMIFLNDMGDTFTGSLPLDWLAKPYGPSTCPNGHKRPRVQWLAEHGVWCCSAAKCGLSWKPSSPLELMAKSPHVWMLLTKRGSRMRQFSEAHPLPPNVWPGVSITKRVTLPRVQELLGVKGGGVRWVSAEPLLEGVDLGHWLVKRGVPVAGCTWTTAWQPRIDFVILGGESGPGARPMRLSWWRSLVRQCAAASVPCFSKQAGAHLLDDTGADVWPTGVRFHVGATMEAPRRIQFRDPKGGDMEEWVEDLRVREFPEVHAKPGN